MLFFVRKISDRLIFESPDRLKGFLDVLPNDIRMAVTIKRYRKSRSNNQNAYYWKCLEIAAESLGYDKEELHDSFKAMFLTDKSRKIPLVRSSTLLTTVEFGVYLEKVLRELAELNITIMTPEEFYAGQ